MSIVMYVMGAAAVLTLVAVPTVVVIALQSLAVDEVRGRIERYTIDAIETAIASLPPDLHDEWADEWRAELEAARSTPVTAVLLAQGLRCAAAELNNDHEVAVWTRSEYRLSTLAKHRLIRTVSWWVTPHSATEVAAFVAAGLAAFIAALIVLSPVLALLHIPDTVSTGTLLTLGIVVSSIRVARRAARRVRRSLRVHPGSTISEV
jgi:hypothetical protein